MTKPLSQERQKGLHFRGHDFRRWIDVPDGAPQSGCEKPFPSGSTVMRPPSRTNATDPPNRRAPRPAVLLNRWPAYGDSGNRMPDVRIWPFSDYAGRLTLVRKAAQSGHRTPLPTDHD